MNHWGALVAPMMVSLSNIHVACGIQSKRIDLSDGLVSCWLQHKKKTRKQRCSSCSIEPVTFLVWLADWWCTICVLFSVGFTRWPLCCTFGVCVHGCHSCFFRWVWHTLVCWDTARNPFSTFDISFFLFMNVAFEPVHHSFYLLSVVFRNHDTIQ